ncbi:MAG: SH3 domain-containing protein [Gammaproteobacteria bacterium]
MELQERTNSLRDYINIVKRRKVQMMVIFGLLMLLTLLITFLLPSVYRSTATILLEEQEVSDDFDQRQSTTEYADARVYKVQQRALTSVNLSAIIEKYSLYRDDINRLPRSEIIEDMREDIRQELVSADVVDPRTGRPTRVTIAFDLSFDHRSPVMAQRVANELVTLYKTENETQGISEASQTVNFYEEQVEKTNREVLDLEDRLARFKGENEGALPEFVPLMMQLLQKTEKDMSDVQRELTALEERRIFFTSNLLQTDPNSGGDSQYASITDPMQQIELVKGQLRNAKSLYGENHPDVRRLQKQLTTLIEEAGGETGQDLGALNDQIQSVEAELVEAKGRYSSEHPEVKRIERQLDGLNTELSQALAGSSQTKVVTAPRVKQSINLRADTSTGSTIVGNLLKGVEATLIDSNAGDWAKIRLSDGTEGFVKKNLINQIRPGGAQANQGSIPTNPAYIQLQGNLATVESQMRSYLRNLEGLKEKAAEYQDALSKAPMVEREFSAIMRDLVDRRVQLQGLKTLLGQAVFKVDVIAGQKGQKFTLIEPPIAATSPHAPDRVALLFLGLVLSLFGTTAFAFIMESMDSAVRKATDILDVSGASPLAAIPVISNQRDQSKSRRNIFLIIGAILGVILTILAIIHFAVKPLDVIWFQMARKFGL